VAVWRKTTKVDDGFTTAGVVRTGAEARNDLRQLVNELLDVRMTGQIDRFGTDRLDRAVAGRIRRRNQRARDDHGLDRIGAGRSGHTDCYDRCGSEEQRRTQAALREIGLIHLDPLGLSRNDETNGRYLSPIRRFGSTAPACWPRGLARLKAS